MKLFIGTGSATYANKAAHVLSELNIYAVVVKRTSPEMNGCGYGVEIAGGDADKIVPFLREKGVKITSVKGDKL